MEESFFFSSFFLRKLVFIYIYIYTYMCIYVCIYTYICIYNIYYIYINDWITDTHVFPLFGDRSFLLVLNIIIRISQNHTSFSCLSCETGTHPWAKENIMHQSLLWLDFFFNPSSLSLCAFIYISTKVVSTLCNAHAF